MKERLIFPVLQFPAAYASSPKCRLLAYVIRPAACSVAFDLIQTDLYFVTDTGHLHSVDWPDLQYKQVSYLSFEV